MRLVYADRCVFFRESGKCAIGNRCCFMCLDRMPRIEGLDQKDHVGLLMGRRSLRISVVLSLVAIILSTLALVAKLLNFGGG